MKTYRVTFTNRMIMPHVFTIRAASLDDARATATATRHRYAADDTIADAREITEPAFLTRWRDRARPQREPAPPVDPAYMRASFATAYVYLTDVLKWTPRECPARATLAEIDVVFSDGVDMTESYFGRHAPIDAGDLDDACALVLHLCPNMPRRMLDRNAVECDLRRAMCDAAEQDYRAQFARWLRESIASAADATGVPWAWHDGEEAQAYPWDADRIAFTISRRAFLAGGGWEPRQSWETQREYMERADDVLNEYVTEALHGAVDVEHFDERGNRYGDHDDWPEYFLDGMSDVVQEWTTADKKMRERLRAAGGTRGPGGDGIRHAWCGGAAMKTFLLYPVSHFEIDRAPLCVLMLVNGACPQCGESDNV